MNINTVMTVGEIAAAVVTLASAVCAMTPTPDPSTTWGKVYRFIEMAAMVVGKAKQTGIVPSNPKIDKVEQSLEQAARDAFQPPKG